jgi:hypothetical protein
VEVEVEVAAAEAEAEAEVCTPQGAAECIWVVGVAVCVWAAADVIWAAVVEVLRSTWATAADAVLSAEEVVVASGMDAGTPTASARAGAGAPLATFGFAAEERPS